MIEWFREVLVRMKNILIAILFFGLGLSTQSSEKLKFSELKTIDGNAYKNVEVIRVYSSAVDISHSKGKRILAIENLPLELRNILSKANQEKNSASLKVNIKKVRDAHLKFSRAHPKKSLKHWVEEMEFQRMIQDDETICQALDFEIKRLRVRLPLSFDERQLLASSQQEELLLNKVHAQVSQLNLKSNIMVIHPEQQYTQLVVQTSKSKSRKKIRRSRVRGGFNPFGGLGRFFSNLSNAIRNIRCR